MFRGNKRRAGLELLDFSALRERALGENHKRAAAIYNLLGGLEPLAVRFVKAYRNAPAKRNQLPDLLLFKPLFRHQHPRLVSPQNRSAKRSIEMVRVVRDKNARLLFQPFFERFVRVNYFRSEKYVNQKGYQPLKKFAAKALFGRVFLQQNHFLRGYPAIINLYYYTKFRRFLQGTNY